MKNRNRWMYLALGVVILLFDGLVYAWSALSLPIAAEFPAWTKAQLSLTFTIVMITFCVGSLVGGVFSRKLSPKLYCWVAAALFAAGFFFASRAHSPAGLYVFFGVFCGFASGLAYNAALCTVGAWFPDKQGLVSGVLLMGFGLSAFFIGKLYQAFTPDVVGAWRRSFVVLGLAVAAAIALCGSLLRKPEAGFTPPAPSKQKKHWINLIAREATPTETMRSPAFWLYYLWAVLLSMAGLAIISQATGVAHEVGGGVSAGAIATAVGLISAFNGIGRVLGGWLFDRIGRRVSMHIVNVLFILSATMMMLGSRLGSFPVTVASFIVIGIAYGCVPTTNSAFMSSYYGLRNYPLNISIVNTNMIFASFGSIIAGSLYDASGSYASIFVMIAVLGALGILVSVATSACNKPAVKAMERRMHDQSETSFSGAR